MPKPVWRRVGTMVNRADTSAGEFLLEVWRYEKTLPAGSPGTRQASAGR